MKVELDSWQDTQTWTLVLLWLTDQTSTATPPKSSEKLFQVSGGHVEYLL